MEWLKDELEHACKPAPYPHISQMYLAYVPSAFLLRDYFTIYQKGVATETSYTFELLYDPTKRHPECALDLLCADLNTFLNCNVLYEPFQCSVTLFTDDKSLSASISNRMVTFSNVAIDHVRFNTNGDVKILCCRWEWGSKWR
jgi:hypothetical protein